MANTKKLFIVLLYCIFVVGHESKSNDIPKIGIIGGGIGGISSAYFLRSIFGANLKLDLFEAEKVGGRLSTVNFARKKYEEGGCIIHSENKYMLDFIKMLSMNKREDSSGYLGLYNGKEFVFSQSDWSIVTIASMFYRYGIGIKTLNQHINDLLKSFSRIYELQDQGLAFDNVTSLLNAMKPDLADYLHVPTKTGWPGVSQIVVDEIVMATIRANYGQNTNIHKFVGSVSVAGGTGSLWAIHDGNSEVPKRLLNISKAQLINQAVRTVTRLPNGKLKIDVKERSDIPIGNENYTYDIVIVAAPQTVDVKYQIEFRDFNNDIEFQGRYHRTVCTLIRGELNETYFYNKKSYTDEILTTEDSVFFNSIGRIYPIDYNSTEHKSSDVWKVFSKKPLTDSELQSLFKEVKDIYVKNWLAYPHYDTIPRRDSFVLDNNLYHVNAIEWAASAMEMSVIGARNVALLASQRWNGKSNDGDAQLPDQNDRRPKTEL